jgi:hypothetical protein
MRDLASSLLDATPAMAAFHEEADPRVRLGDPRQALQDREVRQRSVGGDALRQRLAFGEAGAMERKPWMGLIARWRLDERSSLCRVLSRPNNAANDRTRGESCAFM